MPSTQYLEKVLNDTRSDIEKEVHRQWTLGPVARVELELEGVIDPIDWIEDQQADTKLLWTERDQSRQVAGIGCIAEAKVDQHADIEGQWAIMQAWCKGHPNLKCYGGIKFNDQTPISTEWEAYGVGRFVLPECELIRSEHRTHLAINVFKNRTDVSFDLEQIRRVIRSLRWNLSRDRREGPQVHHVSHVPPKEDWEEMVSTGLAKISDGTVKKVVLARRSDIATQEKLDWTQLYRRLRHANTHSFFFAFQLNDQQCFLGASPERLFRVLDCRIESEAIAGTRPRGKDAVEDTQYEHDLAKSAKDSNEHTFVCDEICRILVPFCQVISKAPHTQVLKLKQVQHLMRPFSGVLNENVSLAKVMNALHPTPAVGGVPKDKGLDEISALEPFDRGWFAGPVGWVGQSDCEFAVAIRSALVTPTKVSAYAGAGIVEGSDPESEWNELNNKVAQYLDILDADTH